MRAYSHVHARAFATRGCSGSARRAARFPPQPTNSCVESRRNLLHRLPPPPLFCTLTHTHTHTNIQELFSVQVPVAEQPQLVVRPLVEGLYRHRLSSPLPSFLSMLSLSFSSCTRAVDRRHPHPCYLYLQLLLLSSPSSLRSFLLIDGNQPTGVLGNIALIFFHPMPTLKKDTVSGSSLQHTSLPLPVCVCGCLAHAYPCQQQLAVYITVYLGDAYASRSVHREGILSAAAGCSPACSSPCCVWGRVHHGEL
jgi:hypothetical protein